MTSRLADANRAAPAASLGCHALQPAAPWRERCLRRALAAVVGLAVLAAGPAVAASNRGASGARSHAIRYSPRPTHAVRAGHARRIHVRHPHRRAGTRVAETLHAGIEPLVNSTWDNPVLPPAVLGAIMDATQASEIAPDLMLTLAWRESRFAPAARSRLSSAAGLLQFTSGTWLQMVRKFGSKHGAARYADAIHRERSGDYTFQGAHMHEAILQLRTDPTLSANLAVDMLGQQRAALQASLTRTATPADLYLTHVLGPSGSARFLEALERRPSASMLKVASRRLLRNAGLLARDGHPMTVANTYAALQNLLADQRTYFKTVLATARVDAPP